MKCSLFERIRFPRSKMSKIENCETNFNLPPKKEFLHFDFGKQGLKTLKSMEINKNVPKSQKKTKKTRFTEGFYSIHTK